MNEQIILAGWLKKKSPSGFIRKAWQKRHFVLTTDKFTYYRKVDDMKKGVAPNGTVPLFAIKEITLSTSKKKRFDVLVGGRTFSLQAASDAECKKWVDVMSKTCQKRKEEANATGSRLNKDDLDEKFWKNTSKMATVTKEQAAAKSLIRTSSKSKVVLPKALPAPKLDLAEHPLALQAMKLELEGPVGSIYRVVDRNTRNEYLVHMFRKDDPNVATGTALLQAFAGLDHPFIFQQAASGSTVDSVWAAYRPPFEPRDCVLTYVRMLKHFPEHVAAFLAAQLVDALDYLHLKKLLFLNLAPDNVFLDSEGFLCIADFLLCLPADKVPRSVLVPEYRPPEGKESPASDFWRLGVFLYEVVVGMPPFAVAAMAPGSKIDQASLDYDSLIKKFTPAQLKFPPDVSASLRDLIGRLMQPDPATRLCSVAEIQKHPWFGHIDWSALSARRTVVPAWLRHSVLSGVDEHHSRAISGQPSGEKEHLLKVHIKSARDVSALLESAGLSADKPVPVSVRVHLFNEMKETGLSNHGDAKFNGDFSFALGDGSGCEFGSVYLRVVEFSKGRNAGHTLGLVTFSLAALQEAGQVRGWFSILNSNGLPVGELELAVDYTLTKKRLPRVVIDQPKKTFAAVFGVEEEVGVGAGDSKAAAAAPAQSPGKMLEVKTQDFAQHGPAPAAAETKVPLVKGTRQQPMQAAGGGALTKKVGEHADKKKRLIEGGLNLDLSYITPRIIAMAFPSSDAKEAQNCNPAADVAQYLSGKHPDQACKVFNLCAEKQYDPAVFGGAVRCVWFPVHSRTPPSFPMLLEICQAMHAHLSANPKHCVALHCKGGKSRTGTIIAAYLVYSAACRTAAEAVLKFAQGRTTDCDPNAIGVPSLRRYVSYMQEFKRLQSPAVAAPSPLRPDGAWRSPVIVLRHVRLTPPPKYDFEGGCDPYFVVTGVHGDPGSENVLYDYRSKFGKNRVTGFHKANPHADLLVSDKVKQAEGAALCGDCKFTFYDYDKVGKDDCMFWFWINTAFVNDKYIVLSKSECDGARKDYGCKHFPPGFTCELFFS